MSRAIQKAGLKAILETLTYNGVNLSVNTYYTSNATVFPYIFITSGALTPNMGNGSLHNRYRYLRGYKYNINIIFRADEDPSATDVKIDDLEKLIVDELSKQTSRDFAGNNNWQDLIIEDVTSPYNVDAENEDSLLAKSIVVTVQYLEEYDG